MSPRASSRAQFPYIQSSTQPAANGTRRAPGQPKSSRQQFSACGACRMRRVRCDLKDLQAAHPDAGHTVCSNCQERGLKCVDEFAEVKAVKLLRRGRRLQQVEAVYGKAAKEGESRFARSLTPPRTKIPKLRPEFFTSSFFRRLHVQRPIIEPTEFVSRFFESYRGKSAALGAMGDLICMVLMTWAVSFGVNEYGEEESHGGPSAIRQRRERTNEMVTEILYLIDTHSLLRKPSWDGIRVLLLLLPLTEGVQTPLDRLTMYEAAINQTYVLCSLASVSSVDSGQGAYIDSLVRMLIFNYAYVHEGITTGLRGGRLLLTDDDLSAFQSTLLPLPHANLPPPPSVAQAVMSYTFVYQYAKAPLRVALTCRQVHSALTGPQARQQDKLDEECLRECWASLESSWDEFEDLRQVNTAGILTSDDVDRFVSGWQISIFECHNIIREALKQRLMAFSSGRDSSAITLAGDLMHDSRATQISPLHAIADAKCHEYARQVLNIVSRQLGTPFFAFDASLVRDGVFFAALLLASGDSSLSRSPSHPDVAVEGVKTCLQALREMRWAFSKSEEREQTLRMVWSSRMAQMRGLALHVPSFEPTTHEQEHVNNHSSYAPSASLYTLRPIPSPAIQIGDSRPNTATTDGSGAWPPLSAGSSAPSYAAMDGSNGLFAHSNSASPPSGPPAFVSSSTVSQLSKSNLVLLDDQLEIQHPEVLNHQGYPFGNSNTSEAMIYPASDISPFNFAPPPLNPVRRGQGEQQQHGMNLLPRQTSAVADASAFFDPVSILFPSPSSRSTSTSGSSSSLASTTRIAQRNHNRLTSTVNINPHNNADHYFDP